MKWLNVDAVRTVTHAVRFLVTRTDAADFNSLLKELIKFRGKIDVAPSELSEAARVIIERARPSLKGCTIVFVDFDASILGWEIIVEHPSLPEVSLGCEVKREFLFGKNSNEPT